MARTISASVGRTVSANRHDDVVTVQELLNQVPPSEGGPQPTLVVDGLCGEKTRGAIQKFQLHHFGWSGADGRVQPGRQTLAKLNQYDQPAPPKPVLPKVTSTQFMLTQIRDAPEMIANDNRDWFFKVIDLSNPPSERHEIIYYFGGGGHVGLRTPAYFWGKARRFSTIGPHAASGLTCSGVYMTRYHSVMYGQSKNFTSYLELRLSSGTIRIPFEAELKPGLRREKITDFGYGGFFQFLPLSLRW